MSYVMAESLQRAVYATLTGDAALTALVGDAVYDRVPGGAEPALFVSIGPEDMRDRSTQTGWMAEHRFVVSVIGAEDGFGPAKAVAVAVSEALDGASPALDRGRVVAMSCFRARVRRVRGSAARRIDLTFRAIVEDI